MLLIAVSINRNMYVKYEHILVAVRFQEHGVSDEDMSSFPKLDFTGT